MKTAFTAAIAALLLMALPTHASATISSGQFLELADAYQNGYLQLLAASTLQIYSTAGLVGTAFRQGEMDGPGAADALSDITLLHGVCYATLLEVQKTTPHDDKVSANELGKLAAVLVEQQHLLLALQDVFSNPTDSNAERVQTAKENVSKLLTQLVAE